MPTSRLPLHSCGGGLVRPTKRPKRTDHKGENNPKAKLTAAQVKEIRRRSAGGESERALAKDFGVHHRTIHDIRSERTWANA